MVRVGGTQSRVGLVPALVTKNGAGVVAKEDLEKKFWVFHQQNPHVYEHLKKLAFQFLDRRPSRDLSINMIFEVMRWEVAFSTSDEDYKLNNSYRSRYARLLMWSESRLNDRFETRELKT